MRLTTLALSIYLLGAFTTAARLDAQVLRMEAESVTLDGFSIVDAPQWSGGARVNGDVPGLPGPSATQAFAGWDGPYDIAVAYCDEDDGASHYTLSGSSAGAIASWHGDQPTGQTICNSDSLVIRDVATSVTLEHGETITFGCVRDPGEPCRVDYVDFTYLGDLAFPGAMGFGAVASGARGLDAEVCVVTSLADSGAGSFRSCAEQLDPAYVTFSVSGYVDLSADVDVAGSKTIECATAPGDGVVFRRARLHIVGGNVILRGCRTWAGDEPGGPPLNLRDGIVVGNYPSEEPVREVIVANCSMMFATDENGGTFFPVEKVTFQHNVSAWAYRRHAPEGDAVGSLGLLVSQNAVDVSVVENFLAFNRGRNPRVAWSPDPVEVVNNLVYCHGYAATEVDFGSLSTHVVGNRYKGRSADGGCNGTADKHVLVRNGSVAYALDNTIDDGNPATIIVGQSGSLATETLFTPGVFPVSSEDVESRVLALAGPSHRIALEIDAFSHYAAGTGQIVESVQELGGWPTLQSGTAPPDGDGDGLPDSWETQHCGGACGPTGDYDGDGYENIEEWFHTFYE